MFLVELIVSSFLDLSNLQAGETECCCNRVLVVRNLFLGVSDIEGRLRYPYSFDRENTWIVEVEMWHFTGRCEIRFDIQQFSQ